MIYRGKQQKWGFNEWHHGLSGRPMGYDGQSWSTAMYIFAQDAVENSRVNILNQKSLGHIRPKSDNWVCGAYDAVYQMKMDLKF